MDITFTELIKERQLTDFANCSKQKYRYMYYLSLICNIFVFSHDPITRLKNIRHFMYM